MKPHIYFQDGVWKVRTSLCTIYWETFELACEDAAYCWKELLL